MSIELHPQGGELLLGYAGGTAIVAQPQPIPVAVKHIAENTQAEPTEKPEETDSEKKSSEELDVPTESIAKEETKEETKEEAPAESPAKPSPAASSTKKAKTGEHHVAANLQAIRAQATEKFRTFSRTIKSKIDNTLNEEKSVLPILPVPPSPRVIRLLPYTQALCCATWRIIPAALASEGAQNVSLEALVAYDDGAYLIWAIPRFESETEEPLIAVNQEVASIPYGGSFIFLYPFLITRIKLLLSFVL